MRSWRDWSWADGNFWDSGVQPQHRRREAHPTDPCTHSQHLTQTQPFYGLPSGAPSGRSSTRNGLRWKLDNPLDMPKACPAPLAQRTAKGHWRTKLRHVHPTPPCFVQERLKRQPGTPPNRRQRKLSGRPAFCAQSINKLFFSHGHNFYSRHILTDRTAFLRAEQRCREASCKPMTI